MERESLNSGLGVTLSVWREKDLNYRDSECPREKGKKHMSYFGEANFEGPESPVGIVKLWCIAERRDSVADGDVIFAPYNYALLNLEDVDSGSSRSRRSSSRRRA